MSDSSREHGDRVSSTFGADAFDLDSAGMDAVALDAVVPFRFACHRCGHCCSGGQGFVWLAPGETSSLADHLGLAEEKFIERYVRRVVDPRSGEIALALREDPNGGDAGGRCILLEGQNTCRAYERRPEHCRRFPYWPSVLTEERAFEAARATCPGIAVEPSPEVRAQAFARLAELHRDVDAEAGVRARAAQGQCCLLGTASDELFATALEADFAVAMRSSLAVDDAHVGCALGRARPLGCRLAIREPRVAPERTSEDVGELQAGIGAARMSGAEDGCDANEPVHDREHFFDRLRAIERELGYPAAYGRLTELLRARGILMRKSR